MTAAPASRYDLTWRRKNTSALLILSVLWAILLGFSISSNPLRYGQAPPILPAKVQSVAERIDPNTASVASLRRLPGIGPVLAEAIVQYRQDNGPDAFEVSADLAGVNGIGPATVNRITPLLAVRRADHNYCSEENWRE